MISTPKRPASERSAERGSALLMAIFVLVLLAGMGVALMFLSQNEVKMSQASLRSKQAFYLAEASIEDARLSLFDMIGGGSFNTQLDIAAGSDNAYFDPDDLQPIFDSSGVPTGISGDGDDIPVQPLTAFGTSSGVDGYYAAYLTNDPLEYGSTLDLNERVMLTGVGIGPGGSFEIVQAILEAQSISTPLPPAAITLLGETPEYEGGSSGAKEYSGTDCAGAGVPGLYVPTVAVVGSTAKKHVLDNLGDAGTYSSGTEAGGSTVADLTDPTDPWSASLDPIFTDCWALRDYMAQLHAGADVVCDMTDLAAGTCVLPPASSERVVFINANYNPPDGEGILVVTRKLVAGGAWNWDGLILVVGTGELLRTGGGPGEILGGIVIANISGPDRTLFTDDDCSEGAEGFADASYVTKGGGGSTVSFCKANVLNSKTPEPYKIVDFLQR